LSLSEFPQQASFPPLLDDFTKEKISPDRQTVNQLVEFVGRVKR